MQYYEPDPNYVPKNAVEARIQAVRLHAGALDPSLEFATLVSNSIFDAPTSVVANATIKSTATAVLCGVGAAIVTGGVAPIALGCAAIGSMIAGVEGAFEAKKFVDEDKKNNPPPPFTDADRQQAIEEMAEKMPHISVSEIQKIVKPADKEKNPFMDAAHTVFVGVAAPITMIGCTICVATASAVAFVAEGAKKVLGKQEQSVPYNQIEETNPAKNNQTIQQIISNKDAVQEENPPVHSMAR